MQTKIFKIQIELKLQKGVNVFAGIYGTVYIRKNGHPFQIFVGSQIGQYQLIRLSVYMGFGRFCDSLIRDFGDLTHVNKNFQNTNRTKVAKRGECLCGYIRYKIIKAEFLFISWTPNQYFSQKCVDAVRQALDDGIFGESQEEWD
eukprot:TRINITY_DN30051_c0_g1_i1.p3 TRINITY_DN30051_c0_g1~~TRINITY_DN30051_c0_g1_i1.p3  ORF type:complete len:145 (+),score=6.98 TRINITY_DN30051_c0_g1_i1:369-803(+)